MTITVPPRNARLPSGPPGSRGGEVRRGLLSTLMLTAVVIGVPVALLIFVGNPLPSTAPGTDWLTADVTIDVVLNLLAVVLWIAWVHFIVCVVIEWRAARQASGLPAGSVGGGSQSLPPFVQGCSARRGGDASAVTTGIAEPPTSSGPQDFVTAERTGGAPAGRGAGDPGSDGLAPDYGAEVLRGAAAEGRRHDAVGHAERTLGDHFAKGDLQLNVIGLRPTAQHAGCDLFNGLDLHHAKTTPVPATGGRTGCASVCRARTTDSEGQTCVPHRSTGADESGSSAPGTPAQASEKGIRTTTARCVVGDDGRGCGGAQCSAGTVRRPRRRGAADAAGR